VKQIAILAVAALFFGSCRTHRVPVRQAVCSQPHHHQPHLDWYQAVIPEGTAKAPLPDRFDVFAVDPKQVLAFFREAMQHAAPVAVPLPAPIGCQTFQVSASGVISPGLAAKYPDLPSLKGIHPSSDLRLDFDGKNMHGQVLWKGLVIFIEPYETPGEVFYLIYLQQNAGRFKQPFESSGQPIDKPSQR
jgi:hypothetical protein